MDISSFGFNLLYVFKMAYHLGVYFFPMGGLYLLVSCFCTTCREVSSCWVVSSCLFLVFVPPVERFLPAGWSLLACFLFLYHLWSCFFPLGGLFLLVSCFCTTCREVSSRWVVRINRKQMIIAQISSTKVCVHKKF